MKSIEKTMNILTEIYIFMIIIVFPLIVDSSGFFHILECKWYAFLVISCTYIVAVLLVFLYFLIFKKINYFKRKKISKIQWIAIIFLLINIVSSFISPYFKNHNLFIGVGRGEGLIMSSLYIITFLFISMFGSFKKRYLLYFSISSILVNTIALLQYIGFNPFNMFQGGIGTHNVSFMTTIGNIDFISAIYTILLSVSMMSYILLDNKRYEKIIHIISIFLGFFILSIIDVQSGKLAFLATIGITLPFLISTNKKLSNVLIVVGTIMLSYCFNVFLNPQYHYDLGKLGLYFQFNYIVILFIIVSLLLFYLARVLRKVKYDISNNKRVVKTYYLLVVIIGVIGLIGVYCINFKSGFLYEIHEILHGNLDDTFGTYRVFLWKRTISLIKEYPILGSGCDTFVLRFMAKYSKDVASIGPFTLNDTAANVYLTMIINLGIVGFVCYILFLIEQIKNGIKNMNDPSKVLLIAMLCFMIQDFFNLTVVIVTPLFWCLMGVHYIACKSKKKGV